MTDHKEITEPIINCLNCDKLLLPSAAYCLNCGQAVKDSKLSVWHIISDAFQNLFNLDSRFFNTLRHIHEPSKLTRAYIEGKRRTYMNPGRLFIFSLIAFITVLLLDIEYDDVSIISENLRDDVELAKQKIIYDSLLVDMGKETDPSFQAMKDSLYGNINLDSMYLGESGFLSIFGFDIRDYKITKNDALNLSNDDLIVKYKVKSLGDRLFVRQYIKAITNPKGGINYVLKNLTWVVLIVIFVMAMLLKLFYIRKNYFYIEHLILLMYNHALLFLIGSIGLLFAHFAGGRDDIAIIISLGIIAIQYLSLKKYYKQGVFKTLVKMLAIYFAYFIVALTILIFGTVISFFIF